MHVRSHRHGTTEGAKRGLAVHSTGAAITVQWVQDPGPDHGRARNPHRTSPARLAKKSAGAFTVLPPSLREQASSNDCWKPHQGIDLICPLPRRYKWVLSVVLVWARP